MVAIVMREPLLLILAVVLALTAALARLWWRFGLSQVSYRREFLESSVGSARRSGSAGAGQCEAFTARLAGCQRRMATWHRGTDVELGDAG